METKWTQQSQVSHFSLIYYLVVIFIVFGVEAVEDGPSKRKDGGSPCKAVAPVKLMVNPQAHCFYELDGK